jgi:hypothetical protein
VVLEHVMAEYLDARPELMYGSSGLVYVLAGQLEAVIGELPAA